MLKYVVIFAFTLFLGLGTLIVFRMVDSKASMRKSVLSSRILDMRSRIDRYLSEKHRYPEDFGELYRDVPEHLLPIDPYSKDEAFLGYSRSISATGAECYIFTELIEGPAVIGWATPEAQTSVWRAAPRLKNLWEGTFQESHYSRSAK